MENTLDEGLEPPRFPCIETEKALSRASGKVKALLEHVPEIWHRELVREIITDLDTARDNFGEVLRNNRAERQRLIEIASSPAVV